MGEMLTMLVSTDEENAREHPIAVAHFYSVQAAKIVRDDDRRIDASVRPTVAIPSGRSLGPYPSPETRLPTTSATRAALACPLVIPRLAASRAFRPAPVSG